MDEYEAFIADLKRVIDLDLYGYKRPQMERRINSLMRTLKVPGYSAFITRMREDQGLLERFIDHLTINVSEFFRNKAQWEVLEKKILPELLSQTANLKIWSAGCSTGEEPYTLAMILGEKIYPGQHAILATDFDKRVLQKAIDGIYSQKAVAGVPDLYLKKYFREIKSGTYQVSDLLKKNITFRQHNLLRDIYPEKMDLIICRNVVIYFTEETKATLYNKMYSALKPGGVLFTGNTEQILQAREIGFESSNVFFYRRPIKK